MNSSSHSSAAEPFEFSYPDEPTRVVRGRVTLPSAARTATELPWVLVLHGFKGFMNWGFFPLLCARLAERGIAAVAFNTSGSGVGPDLETFSDLEAFRRDTLSRQFQDIERVRDKALSGELGRLSRDRRALFGHSRGAGAAIVHAAEDGGYRALATWAAVDDFDIWDAATKDLWRKTGTLPILNARTGQLMPMGLGSLIDYEAHAARFDIRAAAARLETPLFLLHGSDDTAVSPRASRAIHELARGHGRLAILEGLGHTFNAVHPLAGVPPDLDDALEQTAGWLSARLG